MFIISIISWLYTNLFVIAISFISYFTVKEIYDEYEARKKLPPGPRGLPFLGSLPLLGKEPSVALNKLSKKYGNVFSIQLGTIPVVILNDFESIKEAFSKDALSGRPEDTIFNAILPQISFGLSSGPVWKEQRRFALHELRNLGFGKTSMEEHINEEINYLFKVIDEFDGKELDVRKVFTPSFMNNICSLILGQRLERHELQLFKDIFEPTPEFSVVGILGFFPALSRFVCKYLFFLMPAIMKELRILSLQFNKFIRGHMDNHEKTLKEDNVRDYTDSFLIEMKQKNRNNSSFTKEMLEGNISMLFGAGSNTVHTTTEWATLILATHPQIQKKLQQEIDYVIGKERAPKYSDRNQMPYLIAFMYEVWRFRSITPVNLPRKTMENTTIQGFNIPKDTQVLANFWAVDYNPKTWENPEEFNPERHLSADKKSFIKSEHLIPFSYGKRSCPGESLGLVEVFLYISSLLQRYDLKPTENTDMSLAFEFQFSMTPKQRPKLSFVRRK